MPRHIRDFLMLLETQQQMSPQRLMDLIDELASRIQHGDIIIPHPGYIEEFADRLLNVCRRSRIPPRYLDKVGRRIMISLEGSPLSFRDEFAYILRRRLRSFLSRMPLFEEVEEKEAKKEKQQKEREEREKVLNAIKKIKLAEGDRVLFFVGAGASKPSPSNIPTVNELLPELWKKSEQIETKPLEKLQKWCRENSIENIEEMLTAVTISNFIIKNTKVHGLLNSVLYPEWGSLKETSIRDIDAVLLLDNMLNTFFSLLVGTMLQAKPNPIHKAIAQYAKEHVNVDILTTNYDGCVDQALDETDVKYNYVLNSIGHTNTLNLVKMHGSINWFYCDACQNVSLPAIKQIIEAITKDIPYSVTGMCRHCNASIKQFIIPPVAHKYLTHPPIVQVWDCGRRILENAKIFIIIGYSFADADDYIAKMLVKAVGQNPEKTVVVVDIDDKAIARCKSFIKSHVERFDEKNRFFSLRGDGAESVPQLIESLKAAKEPPKVKKKVAS